MRVCDITKHDQVSACYVVLEIPLDAAELVVPDGGRVVYELEVGDKAAQAIEGKDWKALNNMTPYRDRPASADRSAAAKRAAATRKANKEKGGTASTTAPTPSPSSNPANGAQAASEAQNATQGS